MFLQVLTDSRKHLDVWRDDADPSHSPAAGENVFSSQEISPSERNQSDSNRTNDFNLQDAKKTTNR